MHEPHNELLGLQQFPACAQKQSLIHDMRVSIVCLGLVLHVHTDSRPQTVRMHESHAVRHGVLTADTL